MSLSTGKGRLIRATKDLRAKWDRVLDDWDDPVTAKFEHEFLADLETQVRTAISAMDEMGELIDKAKRDCS